MTLTKDLKRCFATCEEAFAYLMRRRFLYLPTGWENEFWTARLDYDGAQFTVTTELRISQAAARVPPMEPGFTITAKPPSTQNPLRISAYATDLTVFPHALGASFSCQPSTST